MKKILAYGAVAGVLGVAGIGGTLMVANSGASADELNNKIAHESTFSRENASAKLDDKNEMVYLITDGDGKISGTFVGNNLYTGTESLPFEFSVRYYLDDMEISAGELAGKSGHVRIIWTVNSTRTSGDKLVPFVAGTSVSLDGAKFSNIKVTNGKIFNAGSSYMVIGYSLPGMNDNLGVDMLPNSFSIEADVAGFELGDTYTILMNDIIADFDTTKLNDLSDVVWSINKLAEGIEQISDGSSQLFNGLDSAFLGAKKLQEGTEELALGVNKLAAGASELNDGVNYLTANYNASLQNGASEIITKTLTDVNSTLANAAANNAELGQAISGMLPITTQNYSENLVGIHAVMQNDSLLEAKSMLDFTTGVIGYTTAVQEQILPGTSALSDGLASASQNMPALQAGMGSLVEGIGELYQGSVKLDEGIKDFKNEGIDKLVAFAQNDLNAFIYNVRQTVSAARDYTHFSNPNAESVKFIVKTARIK